MMNSRRRLSLRGAAEAISEGERKESHLVPPEMSGLEIEV